MPGERDAPRLAIILVNHGRWQDTLECLESVLRSSLQPRVVVVDNGTGDNALDKIAAWARGEQPAMPAEANMAAFSTPPLAKPIRSITLTAAQAVATAPGDVLLTLIDGRGNQSFAANNNLGLRHLLRDPAIDYFWLLDSAAVIEPGAAMALCLRMDATHMVGMCGTVVRSYNRPRTIEALNGHRFSTLSGRSTGIGHGQPITMPFDPARVARETDFVLGKSLAVSRRFIEVIGLMEESYVLYFEEIDWAYRNNGRFATAFAHGAIVYHKDGGAAARTGTRSHTDEYYLMRSRHSFVRRRQPLLLPVQWGVSAAMIARSLLRRQPKTAAVMAKAMFGIKL